MVGSAPDPLETVMKSQPHPALSPAPLPRRRPRLVAAGVVAAFAALVTLGVAAQAAEGVGGRPGGFRPPTGGPPRVTRPPVTIPRPADQIRGARGRQVRGPRPDLDRLEGIIESTVDRARWSDTVWSVVFWNWVRGDKIGSCVTASTKRANRIARDIAQAIRSGDFDPKGHVITVGVRSGYVAPNFLPVIGGASFHTYTVVEVKTARGETIEMYEVDSYVIPESDIDRLGDTLIPSQFINWKNPKHQSTKVRRIK